MAAALVVPQIVGYAVDAPTDLSDPAARRRLSPAAIAGFFRIMETWRIRDADARHLLGGISTGSWHGLKREAKQRTLDQDTLTRVSLLLGIFKALNILYSDKLADAWISLPNRNPIFGGDTPLRYMLHRGVPGMLHVRQLLDGRRGGQ